MSPSPSDTPSPDPTPSPTPENDDGWLKSWYACPICGEKFLLPVDSEPRNDKELDWVWENVARPLVMERSRECNWAVRLSHV